VYFVVFEGTWDESKQTAFVSGLSCMPGSETLLIIDGDGKVSVPRIVPSSNPSRRSAFLPSLPWTSSRTGVVQTSIALRDDFAAVEVLAMSQSEMNVQAFVGRVSAVAGPLSIVVGDLVVGIMSSLGCSNVVAVPSASLARLSRSDETITANIAGAALGLVIGTLACGVSALHSLRRHQGGKLLLVHARSVVRSSLKWFLKSLGFETIEIHSESPAEVGALTSQFDLIVSGSDRRADFQACSHKLARNGRLFMWNDPHTGLASILGNNPLAVGEALDFAVSHVAGNWPSDNTGIHITDIPLPAPGTLVPYTASLFDAGKAYILVGGIGGLGIRIALWMYEVRYYVLVPSSVTNLSTERGPLSCLDLPVRKRLFGACPRSISAPNSGLPSVNP
jgi:hypothetical protein